MKHPSDRTLKKLEAAVRSRVGFDPQLVGDESLLRAICQHTKERYLSHGDAYVGLRQCWSIIDSITYHNNCVTLLLIILHDRNLIFRKCVCAICKAKF